MAYTVDVCANGYRWDGARVTVRGTLQPMDAETEAQFRAYLHEAGFGDDEIGPDDTCAFRPLPPRNIHGSRLC